MRPSIAFEFPSWGPGSHLDTPLMLVSLRDDGRAEYQPFAASVDVPDLEAPLHALRTFIKAAGVVAPGRTVTLSPEEALRLFQPEIAG